MDLFWIGLGVVALSVLVALIAGTRSRDTGVGTAAKLGLFLGVMAAFPLLAIGLANVGG